MKKQKYKNLRLRVRNADRDPRAARPPAAPAQPDALESALTAAARVAEEYPEEAEAIENVIRFVRGVRQHKPTNVQLRDVLLAASILITALDRDPTPEELEMFAVIDAMHGIQPRTYASSRAAVVDAMYGIQPRTYASSRPAAASSPTSMSAAITSTLRSIARHCAPTPSPPAPYSRFAA